MNNENQHTKQLSKEEFIASVKQQAGIDLKHHPELRKGQSIFNAVDTMYGVGSIVQLNHSIDCFYDDSKIDEFLDKCWSVYEIYQRAHFGAENEMERITDIKQLKPGDKIVKYTGEASGFIVIEFLCEHPHSPRYSLFLDNCQDGMKKFWNDRLQDEKWYRYEDSKEFWNKLHIMEVGILQKEISSILKRIDKNS